MADLKRFKRLLRNAFLLFSVFLTTTACTNDESNNIIENNLVTQKSNKTLPLDYRYQTQEEIDRRLTKINARFNTNWSNPGTIAPNRFTEKFFVNLENYLKEKEAEEVSLNNTQK